MRFRAFCLMAAGSMLCTAAEAFEVQRFRSGMSAEEAREIIRGLSTEELKSRCEQFEWNDPRRKKCKLVERKNWEMLERDGTSSIIFIERAQGDRPKVTWVLLFCDDGPVRQGMTRKYAVDRDQVPGVGAASKPGLLSESISRLDAQLGERESRTATAISGARSHMIWQRMFDKVTITTRLYPGNEKMKVSELYLHFGEHRKCQNVW